MARTKRQTASAIKEASTPPYSIEPNQSIARVVVRDGGNLYTCELPDKRTVSVELADRFQKSVWIRNGGFVLVEAYANDERGGRVHGLIINVVGDETLWRKQPYWPNEFPKLSGYEVDEDEESTVGKMPPSDSDDE